MNDTNNQDREALESNTLVKWVNDGCPPINLNDHASKVVELVAALSQRDGAGESDCDYIFNRAAELDSPPLTEPEVSDEENCQKLDVGGKYPIILTHNSAGEPLDFDFDTSPDSIKVTEIMYAPESNRGICYGLFYYRDNAEKWVDEVTTEEPDKWQGQNLRVRHFAIMDKLTEARGLDTTKKEE